MRRSKSRGITIVCAYTVSEARRYYHYPTRHGCRSTRPLQLGGRSREDRHHTRKRKRKVSLQARGVVVLYDSSRKPSTQGAQLEINVKDRVPKKDQIIQGEQNRPIIACSDGKGTQFRPALQCRHAQGRVVVLGHQNQPGEITEKAFSPLKTQ